MPSIRPFPRAAGGEPDSPAGSRRRLLSCALGLALVGLPALPSALEAQYFGRNKVQYDRFDWRVLRTDHFNIHFYPVEAEAVEDAGRMSERWYARLSRALDHEFVRRPVVLYANHPDFQQTNVIGGFISEGTGGVTEGLRSRMVMPFTGLYHGTDHVLGHELVHVFQYDIAGATAGAGGGGISAMSRLPLWIVEGMAEYLSVGRMDAHSAMWLRDALRRDDLPTLDQLSRDPRFFPYRWGQAFWAFVAGLYGDDMVNQLFRESLASGFEEAIPKLLGLTDDSLSVLWQASIREDYLPVLEGRSAPGEVGRRVLAPEIDAGEMNIAPVISPDGRHVIFLSEIDLFSIDLYLADAETGEVLEEVATSQSSSHIDALSFIESAGTWSPDGQKFAFVVIAEGDNQLAIANVRNGEIERRIAVPGVDGMRDPAWSPDGRQIVVSGLVGGRSDLYVIDVASGSARQLTSDAYGDIHPSWSPDGRTIVFSTDRGPRTSLELLHFGPLQVATIPAAGGPVELLDIFDGAKHIDPHFSPDGGSLFFISDPEGVPDVFRMNLATGELYRVTRVATGISGITAEAPALTIASGSGRMMFSIFEEGNYSVHMLEPVETGGTPIGREAETVARAAILPPRAAFGEGFVHTYLNEPSAGLPPVRLARGETSSDDLEWRVRDYDPDIDLLYLGSPTVGVASDQFGTSLGGAVSGYFSDLLGNRELFAAVAAQGSVKDIGAQATYVNRENRWNYGVSGGHIPYLSLAPTRVIQDGGATGGQVLPGDTVTLVQQRQRVFVDRLQGMGQYPFSMTRRFEVQAGYTRYGFDFEELQQTVVITPTGGARILDEQRADIDLPGQRFDPLHFVETSAALVGDNSFFGFTSPVSGQRYRFEAGGTFGSLSYGQLLGDYRRYLFWNPLTVAMRGYHFGRWGGDADNGRLQPLFLGYPTLIRGYDIGSFSMSECTPTTGARFDCAELDRLIGSKMAVGNFELRLPLFGVERYGLLPLGFLPVEIATFFDAGVAWTGEDGPDLQFSVESAERIPVFSTGATARVNLLGYMIIEAYYAYPFQRPDKGWHWGFNLSPGW